uniref:Peroxidase n=1 Tax=Populus alba TaxID=43335 RepID=A0A4U5LSS3_POPAL|nr:peroxidase 60-like [Populus alba]
MEMPRVAAALALALSLIFVSMAGQCSGQLQFGFYNGKCRDRNGFQRDVEDIVKQKVEARFSTDTTIVAALLRMQFHDCFVNSDKKSRTGWYPVQTGRRDGRVSSAQNVKLPSPSIPVPQAIAAFNSKRLSTIDMVYLLGGGHSVGVAHCGLFQNRLYDFKNTGNPDPTMNTTLLKTLQTLCPQNSNSNNSANLDQDPLKSSSVDKSFFEQIRLGNGILEVDQQLALDSNTRFSVARVAGSSDFSFQFGRAMIKLGAVDVKIGKDGEIRKRCAAVNSPSGNSGENIFNIFG